MKGPEPRRISDSTFVIVTNGFLDGPAHALREYLLRRNARRVTFVSHPLTREEPAVHEVTTYTTGATTHRSYRVPNLAPFTYAIDPFIPLWPKRTTAWFGFNNLATLRGLAAQRLRRAEAVYYWAVDFVPSRFGEGLLTAAYERADRVACSSADARIELSETALEARTRSLGSQARLAPAIAIPMGAWLDRTPAADSGSWERQKVVYLGRLTKRQGVANLVEAMRVVGKHNPRATLEIVGDGPEAPELRRIAKSPDLRDLIHFHGRVEKHEDVERVLAGGTVAVAPYLEKADNYTQFADPGKIKAYLAAGLPVVMTKVPPNAAELESAGVALVSGGTPPEIATAIQRFLSDRDLWLAVHMRALDYAKRFDWNTVLEHGLGELGWQ